MYTVGSVGLELMGQSFSCLAKMQRAGAAECPLCRARTVLQADRCEYQVQSQNLSRPLTKYQRRSITRHGNAAVSMLPIGPMY